MIDYFRTYYIAAEYGPGYVMTNIFFAAAAVILLDAENFTWKRLLKTVPDMFLCWLGGAVFCSIVYSFAGHTMYTDRIMMALTLLVYSLFRSGCRPITKILRSVVFYSCLMQIIPISEPIGELITENINAGWTWAMHLTWIIVVAMGIAVLVILRRYSTENVVFVPKLPAGMAAVIAFIGVMVQTAADIMEIGRWYTVFLAVCFWLIDLAVYYIFYLTSVEYDRNLELASIQHKERLDEQLQELTRESYDETRRIRHEVKNHLAYLSALVERREYSRLQAYLEEFSGDTEELLKFIDCGNDVVNAVLNYAVKQGKSRGVTFEMNIVVPKTLPYKDTAVCSLLTNLCDNAIEAAAVSGESDPTVTVSILPQRDYLFIKVTNPVDGSIPDKRRLLLKTTKSDASLHGYGTKIIRSIARQYEGSSRFDIQNGRFVADIMLYLGADTNEGETEAGDM